MVVSKCLENMWANVRVYNSTYSVKKAVFKANNGQLKKC